MVTTTPKRDARRAAAHADAVRKLERAETRLHRAFTAWSDARARVRVLERELDRALALTPAQPETPFDDPITAVDDGKGK